MNTTARAALVRSLCARLNDERRTDEQLRAVDRLLMELERDARDEIKPVDMQLRHALIGDRV